MQDEPFLGTCPRCAEPGVIRYGLCVRCREESDRAVTRHLMRGLARLYVPVTEYDGSSWFPVETPRRRYNQRQCAEAFLGTKGWANAPKIPLEALREWEKACDAARRRAREERMAGIVREGYLPPFPLVRRDDVSTM